MGPNGRQVSPVEKLLPTLVIPPQKVTQYDQYIKDLARELTGGYLESAFNLPQPSHSTYLQAKDDKAHGHTCIGRSFSQWLPILHPKS